VKCDVRRVTCDAFPYIFCSLQDARQAFCKLPPQPQVLVQPLLACLQSCITLEQDVPQPSNSPSPRASPSIRRSASACPPMVAIAAAPGAADIARSLSLRRLPRRAVLYLASFF
jgi:hypothetical protein